MNTVDNGERNLPAGIQDFEKLREFHSVYVDKTEYVYKLVKTSVPFYLSRPRRFGKSLLLSTIAAYWEGKKELFNGLKIEQLEEYNKEAWKAHPVFYFDFSGINYTKENLLEEVLDTRLKRWEKQYECTIDSTDLGVRF